MDILALGQNYVHEKDIHYSIVECCNVHIIECPYNEILKQMSKKRHSLFTYILFFTYIFLHIYVIHIYICISFYTQIGNLLQSA